MRRRRNEARSGLFFIVEQIIGSSEGGVRHHQDGSDKERHQDVGDGTGEEEERDGQHRHDYEHDTVADHPAKEEERLIAEEVEEEPRRHEHHEHDQRYRMPEETEEEHDEHHDGVVHLEVGDVLPHAPQGVGETAGKGKGVEVEHDLPWAARGEPLLHTLLGA